MGNCDRDKHDHSLDYLESASKSLALTPNEGVTITGGEPSFHKQFQELAPKLRSIFNARIIAIETNGYGFRKFPEAFLHFDKVCASPYDGSFGGPSNKEDIAFMRSFMREHGAEDRFEAGPDLVHWPKQPGKTGMCYRGQSGTVMFFDGLLYGCCAASGQPNKVGCEITPTWRDDVVNLPLPCDGCPFAQ